MQEPIECPVRRPASPSLLRDVSTTQEAHPQKTPGLIILSLLSGKCLPRYTSCDFDVAM